MNFLKRVTDILVKPHEEFLEVKKETDLKPALVYLLPLVLISTVLQLVTGLPSVIERTIESNVGKYVLFFVSSIIILYIVAFIIAGSLYLVLKFNKHREHFKDTFNVTAYGMTPYLLLGWMPLVSILAVIYMIVLQIKGIQEVLKISRRDAIVNYISVIVFWAIIFAIGSII